jgi:hypothetical protein
MFVEDRKVIISSHFRQNRFSDVKVPMLRLSGNWLTDAGFKVGEYVHVQVIPGGNLVIKKMEVEQL